MTGRGGYGAPAVTRAIALLGALAVHGPSNATELSRFVGISKSSVGDICSALTAANLISRRRDGDYVLGLQVERLAGRLGGDPRLYELFDNALSAEESLDAMTVTLDVLYGGELVCLAARLGRLPLPSTPRPGMRHPFLTSAGGSAIAQATPVEVLHHHFDAFAEHQPSADREPTTGRGDATTAPHAAATALQLPNGAWHVAAAVPWHREAPVLAAVVVQLPGSTTPELVETTKEAATRCAHAISENLVRRARISDGQVDR